LDRVLKKVKIDLSMPEKEESGDEEVSNDSTTREK
jgi:hypothetical protein